MHECNITLANARKSRATRKGSGLKDFNDLRDFNDNASNKGKKP